MSALRLFSARRKCICCHNTSNKLTLYSNCSSFTAHYKPFRQTHKEQHCKTPTTHNYTYLILSTRASGTVGLQSTVVQFTMLVYLLTDDNFPLYLLQYEPGLVGELCCLGSELAFKILLPLAVEVQPHLKELLQDLCGS